ncbi:hypothetical protein ANN_06746 [Periplaneta americana]|uniref:Uncharacterized protein n=1 Tax=Periplaneta americana TaxID=6978 RepID=A0ABQ8TGT4_PERAM|nr:hypothetical protein ANN_06746 [Periplaneta americana]
MIEEDGSIPKIRSANSTLSTLNFITTWLGIEHVPSGWKSRALAFESQRGIRRERTDWDWTRTRAARVGPLYYPGWNVQWRPAPEQAERTGDDDDDDDHDNDGGDDDDDHDDDDDDEEERIVREGKLSQNASRSAMSRFSGKMRLKKKPITSMDELDRSMIRCKVYGPYS